MNEPGAQCYTDGESSFGVRPINAAREINWCVQFACIYLSVCCPVRPVRGVAFRTPLDGIASGLFLAWHTDIQGDNSQMC